MVVDRRGQLKPGGIVLLLLLAGGLILVGSSKLREQLFPSAAKPQAISQDELRKITEGQPTEPAQAAQSANPAGTSALDQPLIPQAGTPPPAGTPAATTVGDYKFVDKQAVKKLGSVGSYAFKDNTVVFPINIWGGWAPIIAANNGFKPNKNSLFFKEFGFQVDLKLIDDPDAARAAFASGQSHVLWGTLDMIALFAEGLSKDPRVFPKVFQQVDWSNGGDGVVVRAHITSANDLKGKTIVLAQNSPSHYYILRVLADAGISPAEVNFKFTDTAFGAAKAFVDNSGIDACVSWAPDIYNIVDEKNGGKKGGVKGARLLTTTQDANNMIADVWAVRTDFAAEHRDLVKGLAIGIFKGMELAAKDPDKVAALMADGFGLGVEDCKSMLGDAHLTNYAENVKFFKDENFAANFDRTWKAASYVYKQYGAVGAPVRPEDVKDVTILNEIEPLFRGSKEPAAPKFSPPSKSGLNVEADPILTKTVQIQFAPNAADLDSNYDATIPQSVEEIGRLAASFGAARIVLEGNVDTSRKMEIEREGPRVYQDFSRDVKELSERRAKSVRDALLSKFKFPKDKITAFGNGWDNPVSLTDHRLNRRVEVKVLPLESK